MITMWLSDSAYGQTASLKMEDLVVAAKTALVEIEDRWSFAGLSLDHIVLELKTVTEVSAQGEVSFYVVEVGGERSQAVSNTMRLQLAPPPSGSGSDVAFQDLSVALATTILAATDAIAEAAKGLPVLVAEEYVAEISFTVESRARGGFSLNFPPFSSRSGGSVSDSAVHSITAVFSR
jgi:hypothetical protein